MFSKLLNQASMELTIEVKGPLLIKSGREGGADPSVPDMQFVRTNGSVYLPGSSLKGIVRSYAEKIARTVGVPCCNPFDQDPKSATVFCGKRAEKVQSGKSIYRNRDYACRVCQLFGSTAMAGRVRFEDAYPKSAPRLEVRTGVAIDRGLGSVAHGPFDLEVVTRGTFKGKVQLRNFELWQVGLLALVLRDLREGRIPLGFGKSRGLGEIRADLGPLTVRYVGARREGETLLLPQRKGLPLAGMLYGIGKLATEEDRQAYGLSERDEVAVRCVPADDWLGVQVTLDEEARESAFKACVEERWGEVIGHDRRAG
jgi:CRISPR-associated RAMP protein (TIGR02581 family)